MYDWAQMHFAYADFLLKLDDRMKQFMSVCGFADSV